MPHNIPETDERNYENIDDGNIKGCYKIRVNCGICEEVFTQKHPHEVYCPHCREIIYRNRKKRARR